MQLNQSSTHAREGFVTSERFGGSCAGRLRPHDVPPAPLPPASLRAFNELVPSPPVSLTSGSERAPTEKPIPEASVSERDRRDVDG